MTGTKNHVTSLLACCLISVGAVPSLAATVTFDFGNANTSNNSQNGGDGNWAPFADETTDISTVVSTTIDGLQMTLSGTAVDDNGLADEFWGINNQGIGVITDGNGGATGRRIDGSIGEVISFSFDQDVTLSSVRLGSFNGNASGAETVTVTPDGGPAIEITQAATSPDPLIDWPLGEVFVSAGTPITLSTAASIGGGVLFNEITVNTVPEPASIVLLCAALAGAASVARRK